MRRSNSNSNNNSNNYEEPCLTMHQPWASLLVNGIKRVEGRSWPSPITGRLWIHAASKVPDAQTIEATENFYREIYAVDGVTDLKFPEQYPVSKLVGCVEVVGCVKREELACWKSVPRGVRLEALTNYCWLCEHPLKLSDPLKMRGDQGIYNLETKIADVAISSLVPVVSPLLVQFPLPNLGDYYSLRPGSLRIEKHNTEELELEDSPSLVAAIAGAHAAAMQYTKRNHSRPTDTLHEKDMTHRELPNKQNNLSPKVNKRNNLSPEVNKRNNLSPEVNRRTTDTQTVDSMGRKSKFVYVEKQKQSSSSSVDRLDKRPGGPSQIFSSALKGIRPI